MPTLKLDTVLDLKCGCNVQFWKVLILLAFRSRAGQDLYCPYHGSFIDACEHLRELAEDFLTFLESDEGKIAFPDMFI